MNRDDARAIHDTATVRLQQGKPIPRALVVQLNEALRVVLAHHDGHVRELHRVVVSLHVDAAEGTLSGLSAYSALLSLLPLDSAQLDDEWEAEIKADAARWLVSQSPARLDADKLHLVAMLSSEFAQVRLAEAEQEIVRLRAECGEAAPAGWRVDWDWDPDVRFAWVRDGDGREAAAWPTDAGARWRVWCDEAGVVGEADADSVVEALRRADAFLAQGKEG